MKATEIKTESSLSRIHSKIGSRATGAITAYRGEFTHRENQQRNRSLLAKLQGLGYSVTAIKGSYIENHGSEDAKEVSEHSYFVASKTEGNDAGKLEKDLIQLGSTFDQDSILSIPYGEKARLVGTSQRENAWPAYGQREQVGGFKGGKAAEFMSRVNNRSFVFEDIEDIGTINGRWGNSILAAKDWQDIEI